MLSKAYDHCVIVYTQEEWEKVAAQLASQPSNIAANRRLNRLTFAGSYPSQLDRSGRVLIPPQLRQYAGLGEDIVLVGAGQTFEIWDRAAWQHERSTLDEQAAEIAEAGASAQRTSAAGGDGS